MQTIFPATYSTLSPEALENLLSEKYKLQNLRCSFLSRGVHDAYLVTCDEDQFILRVYRSSHRSLSQIEEEVDLLLTLQQKQVPVSYPVTDTSNNTIQRLNAIEGERFAVLFTYAPGVSIRTFTENELKVLGKQMAAFHLVSEGKGTNTTRWHFDASTMLHKPLETLALYFKDNSADYEWLKKTATKIERKLLELNSESFSKGYCHFDFLPKNFHFKNEAVTFFDFDFMGHGALVNDMMSFWQHLQLDVYAGRIKQSAAEELYAIFLASYCNRRPLTKNELTAIPYLSLGFWLFYMEFHTTHDQFYMFTQTPHQKIYIGFLRQLEEKYWRD